MDVEEARHLVALVPEPVGDVARDDDERPGGRLERDPVAQLEGQRALQHEPGVGVLAVDVQVGPPLARPVDGLGQGQLLGVREERHPAALPLDDRLALGATEAADDGGGRIDAAAHERAAVEPLPGTAAVLVGLGGHQRAHVRPDSAGRGVHVDEPGGLVARGTERVDDALRHLDPRLRAGDAGLALELEPQRALEDEEAVGVAVMHVRRRRGHAGGRQGARGAEVLHVREQRHPEPGPVGEQLAVANPRRHRSSLAAGLTAFVPHRSRPEAGLAGREARRTACGEHP